MNLTAVAKDLLFVGSYADPDRPGIHAFSFDSGTGMLEPRAAYAGVANPSFLVVHPRMRTLYAVSELSGGCVCAFRFDRRTGELAPLNRQPSRGGAPCHLTLDASGNWLVVSNYASGTVCVFPIVDGGALGEAAHLVQHQGRGAHPKRQTGPHAHSAALAPDGRFVLVADLGIDQILVYAFDQRTGKLGPRSSTPARPGAGPRHLAFHPRRNAVFVVNELDSTISVYEYDATSGHLHARQSLPTIPPGAAENSAADVHVAPDGTRVYVSNRGHDSIAAFDVAASGELVPGTIKPCGGHWPRSFAIEPAGRFMLIANQRSGDVTVLPLAGDEAELGRTASRAAVPGASCVQLVAS